MHFLQFDPKKMQWSNNSELEFCINYRLYTDRNTLDDSSKLVQKSVNLQYTCNTLGCLDNGTNESSTKHLMLQVLFFFHDFLESSLQKSAKVHQTPLITDEKFI